jgi:pyruvate kinase
MQPMTTKTNFLQAHSRRRTKIVATLGPASQDERVLRAMLRAGLNVARINFSHGNFEDHRQRIELLRRLAAEEGCNIAILQDLQGPKIRTGRFTDGFVMLEPGQTFVITADDIMGDVHRVSTTYKELPNDVKAGEKLLLDDGNLALEVTAVRGNDIITRVVIGGKLSNNKGINIPGADLSTPALTEKDIEDMKAGVDLDVDWVAMSFVRSRDDLTLARDYMRRFGSQAKLMAKIEKPSAVERFSEILASVDGIMVARGDLGVEQVPVIQKRLIAECRRAGKPVITATQMLESMKDAPRPTRAEASDVANAIFDGTDAVMLSAESASGSYPVEAVETMDKIARNTEQSQEYYERILKSNLEAEHNTQDALALAAVEMAATLEAGAVVCYTSSGSTASRVTRHRPTSLVIALTPKQKPCNQMALYWGVEAIKTEEITNTDEMVALAQEVVVKSDLIPIGAKMVITAGVPFGRGGTTNMLRVEQLALKDT